MSISTVPYLAGDGSLPVTTGTLATSGSYYVELRNITVVNPSATTAYTFNLYILRKDAGAAVRISPRNLSLAVGSMYETGPHNLFPGDVLQGDVSVNLQLTYSIAAFSYV